MLYQYVAHLVKMQLLIFVYKVYRNIYCIKIQGRTSLFLIKLT